MSDPTITLNRVGKRYGDDESAPWAARDVSFCVHPGEVTLLMGPSGSGKTTVLSLIGGLLSCSEGRIDVCGAALHSLNEDGRQAFRRTTIGFVFQSCNLLTALTARENVQVALSLRGKNTDLANELLDSVGLGDKANAYPAQLSGGQRQRIAVVRALAGGVNVLLADEPTAALDAVQGRRVMELLRARAHRENMTMLVVTHDPRVREFADRVIEMEDGGVKRLVRRIRREAASFVAPRHALKIASRR